MRFLIVTAVVVLGVACGDGETTEPPPTSTPDERVEYWAESLAQQQLDLGICGLQAGSGGFIGSDDSIPPEILEDVSIRMSEKLQEKCASDLPTVPPECEAYEERYKDIPPFSGCPAHFELPFETVDPN